MGQDLTPLQLAHSQMQSALGTPVDLAGESFPLVWSGLEFVLDRVDNPSGIGDKVLDLEDSLASFW